MTAGGQMSDERDCGADAAAFVLGALEPSEAQAFRAHPDHGGSHAAMVRINAAYELALAAC